jgi:hypothetical protein
LRFFSKKQAFNRANNINPKNAQTTKAPDTVKALTSLFGTDPIADFQMKKLDAAARLKEALPNTCGNCQ